MEKLYNNIAYEPDSSPSDAQNVPYLKNPPEIIDISIGRQLFVDDFLIESTDLAPEYHNPKKFEGNPILFPETPWETDGAPAACPKSGGVWYDEEERIYKMWYEGTWLKNMCYATSKDGIHWERPDLGIVKGTNMILPYENYTELEYHMPKTTYLRPDSTTVFIDYNAPKDEKYKLYLHNPGGCFPAVIAVSGDGIHFHDFALAGDMNTGDRSTIFYNPFRKKWVYSVRAFWSGRCRSYRESDNYLALAAQGSECERRWMACDNLDKANPYIGFPPQLYNIDCVAYESIMLGMFQIMYGPENDVCEKAGVPKITELMPMYSRDGFHFSRPCRKTFLNASIHEGAWDRGYVQSVGGLCIIHGDELWIYYIGFGGDTNKVGVPWTQNGMYCNGATGLAKLRRDGFVSMNGSGTLTTRLFECHGKRDFYINAVGTVSVELLSADGTVLARSEEFCGNSTAYKMNFGDFDVSTLNNAPFRLRFHVSGKLYSFGLADENGDFGGAHAAGLVK